MKTAIKYIFLLLLFVSASANAQSNKIEKEYLTKLAESFNGTNVKAKPSKYFWSLCLGESKELSNTELSTHIKALINDEKNLIAFYKRMNHYVPSSINYRTDLLDIQEYVTITPVAPQPKHGKKAQPAPAPYQTWESIFTFDELRSYLSYISSHGIDKELSYNCSPENFSPPPPPPPPPSSTSSSDGVTKKPASTEDSSQKVFTYVEIVPEFAGGDVALIKFLQQNILYPQMERDNDIQGKVLIRFVVCEDGRVSNVSVFRGVSQNLDMESVRVVKMLPNFKPGSQDGKFVRVFYTLPIIFKLQ